MTTTAGVWRRPGTPANPFSTSVILWAAAIHVALGCAALAAWSVTGCLAWTDLFFQYPGAIFLVELAVIQLRLSIVARRQFSLGEPLGSAWFLIAVAAGCRLVGAVCNQIFGLETLLNPLAALSSPSTLRSLRDFGAALGGPLQSALVAWALFCVLRLYRQCGILKPLGHWKWLVAVFVAASLTRDVCDVAASVRAGAALTPATLVRWGGIPVLMILLVEAAMLYRSAAAMGRGLIARCWRALAAAVFLAFLGDIGNWAIIHGYLQAPWNSITWYIWCPAAVACALGPLWQVEASTRAAGQSAA